MRIWKSESLPQMKGNSVQTIGTLIQLISSQPIISARTEIKIMTPCSDFIIMLPPSGRQYECIIRHLLKSVDGALYFIPEIEFPPLSPTFCHFDPKGNTHDMDDWLEQVILTQAWQPGEEDGTADMQMRWNSFYANELNMALTWGIHG